MVQIRTYGISVQFLRTSAGCPTAHIDVIRCVSCSRLSAIDLVPATHRLVPEQLLEIGWVNE